MRICVNLLLDSVPGSTLLSWTCCWLNSIDQHTKQAGLEASFRVPLQLGENHARRSTGAIRIRHIEHLSAGGFDRSCRSRPLVWHRNIHQ